MLIKLRELCRGYPVCFMFELELELVAKMISKSVRHILSKRPPEVYFFILLLLSS